MPSSSEAAASIKSPPTLVETNKKATHSSSSSNPEQAQPLLRKVKEYDQCGLEDDPHDAEEWGGPKRERASRATAAQTARYRAIVERCFAPAAVAGVRVRFHPAEVIEVAAEVQTYLRAEPVLIEDVPLGVTVIGDLHGQLHDLARVFAAHARDGKPGWECGAKYLFLGDYVDRGRQALEVVIGLFALKILYPDNFFLLRGNHEFMQTNISNGFCEEIRQRFAAPEVAYAVYFALNEAFCWLSVCAIIGNKFFCVHAGISPFNFTRAQLRGLVKPILFTDEDVLIHDMLWSDPAVGLRGTVFNTGRRTSIYYGVDALCTALTGLDCIALVRGHDMRTNGYDILNNICITVFTATAVYEGDNKGAFIQINEQGKLSAHIMEVDKARVERDRRVFDADNDDAKTVCDELKLGQAPNIGE